MEDYYSSVHTVIDTLQAAMSSEYPGQSFLIAEKSGCICVHLHTTDKYIRLNTVEAVMAEQTGSVQSLIEATLHMLEN